jgi:cell division protein FtsB
MFMRRLRRFLVGLVAPAALFGVAAYFIVHANEGDHGIRAYELRLHQKADLLAEVKKVEAERDALQVRVAGLQSNHIDLDTLDERARAMYNLQAAGEIVVPYPQGQKLFNDHD